MEKEKKGENILELTQKAFLPMKLKKAKQKSDKCSISIIRNTFYTNKYNIQNVT